MIAAVHLAVGAGAGMTPAVRVVQKIEVEAGTSSEAVVTVSGDVVYRSGRSYRIGRGGRSKLLFGDPESDQVRLVGRFGRSGACLTIRRETGLELVEASWNGKRTILKLAKEFTATRSRGAYVCGFKREGRRVRAFRWNGGSPVLLTGSGSESEALDVGEDGSVAGNVVSGGWKKPCRWDAAGKLHGLALPKGFRTGVASLVAGGLTAGLAGFGRGGNPEVDEFDGSAVWRSGKIDRRFDNLPSAKSGFVGVTCWTGGSDFAGYSLRKGIRSAVTVHPDGRILPVEAKGSGLVFDSVVDGGPGYLLAFAHSSSPLKSFLVRLSLR